MKIPFLPAALLTMAAILVSCTKEQNPPETMNLGKPFVVHVLNNGKGTRDQAITAVSSFNMVGIQGASNKWMDNLLFTNPGDGCPEFRNRICLKTVTESEFRDSGTESARFLSQIGRCPVGAGHDR